jgi:hypothetical protein
VLLPLVHLASFGAGAPELMPDDLVARAIDGGTPERSIELGDPGTTIDGSTPRAQLPPFEGPPEPAGGHVHEWGAAAAAAAAEADVALEGPGLAPYGQAVAEVPDQPG